MAPRISVVVPAYNEARFLPRLLATLDAARARYRGGADAIEVIVADNGSTDDTPKIARAHGCMVVPVEKRIIAAVRNGGARAASGEIVAWIDADAQLHPETLNAVDDFFADPRHIVGVSGAELERRSLGINVVYAVWLTISTVMRIDTGFVCCRRSDWEAVGGYREDWTFGEDVWFLQDLKKLGRSRGQQLGWLQNVKSVFSTRKFDEHGEWHYVAAMALTPLWFVFSRRTIDRWVERYWYGKQRDPSGAPGQEAK